MDIEDLVKEANGNEDNEASVELIKQLDDMFEKLGPALGTIQVLNKNIIEIDKILKQVCDAVVNLESRIVALERDNANRYSSGGDVEIFKVKDE